MHTQAWDATFKRKKKGMPGNAAVTVAMPGGRLQQLRQEAPPMMSGLHTGGSSNSCKCIAWG